MLGMCDSANSILALIPTFELCWVLLESTHSMIGLFPMNTQLLDISTISQQLEMVQNVCEKHIGKMMGYLLFPNSLQQVSIKIQCLVSVFFFLWSLTRPLQYGHMTSV